MGKSSSEKLKKSANAVAKSRTPEKKIDALAQDFALFAHEIRNPLGGIKGFAALLERDLKDQPKLHKLAKYIVDGTNDINRLISRVLDFSRPYDPILKLTNLKTLLEEVRENVLSDKSFKHNNQIKIVTTLKSLTATVDPQLLRSALLNLILNAIQAMPERGTVTLSLDTTEDDAVVRVTDTGIGIPSENIKKVFSPFFTTKIDGNGFGLSEVQKIVNSHLGTIDLDSEVGKGTTITIKIPIKIKG